VIARRFSDVYTKAKFYKLDVDEVPDVAQELGIRAMPTFLLFKNKEKIGEVVGANPKALEAAIQKGLAHGEEEALAEEEKKKE
jgi:thioredoxin 1